MSGRVAVVVLTFQGRQLTLDCLRSLSSAEHPDRLGIFVVDNASGDDTVAAVRERFPSVTLIQSATNLGFAGGNNLGIAAALEQDYEHILVLNNDTLVAPDLPWRLRNALEQHPEAGAASPLITFAGEPGRVWYAGATYRAERAKPGRMLGYRRPVAPEFLREGTTDRFTGCAVMFPAQALRDVGPFDPELFFLYEDVDLSLRLRRAGRTIRYVPTARVAHRVAMTQGGELSPTSFYYGIRNQLVVADRFAPRSSARRAVRAAATVAVFLARSRRARPLRPSLAATFAGLRDYRRRHLGKWAQQA